MVELFSLKAKSKVLDPCFGRGVFVSSLLEKTNYHVDGVEIDERSYALFDNPNNERCTLSNCDFFDVEERYDGIIMNPPYVRQEEINDLQPLGVNKKKLQSACGLMAISTKANLYMYFILRAIILLQDKGELIAIFPVSWTNTPIGKQFYEQICHFGCITDFINVEGEAFEGTPMVDVCIIKFIKGGLGKTIYKQMTITKSNIFSIKTIDNRYENKATALVKLQSVAKIRRGITTGFNKIFINPPLFSQNHLVQILSSPKNIIGYSTNSCKQDNLLAIQQGDILGDEESAYLENSAKKIVKEGKPQSLKSMIEKCKPWYYIPIQDKAQILISHRMIS